MMKSKQGSYSVGPLTKPSPQWCLVCFFEHIICLSGTAGRCPLGTRVQAFIHRKQSWIMSCNAAVVRVNSLETRDEYKRTGLQINPAGRHNNTVALPQSLPPSLSLLHSFSVLSADAQAIFSAGSSFSTASTTTTTHFSPLNSSLHIARTSASIRTLQLNPVLSLNDLSCHSAPSLPSSLLICLTELGRQRECW